jgi:hypothetical protein
MNFRFFTGFMFLLATIPCIVYPETLIPASDPNINYFGRFEVSKPAAPQFNWSGSAIEASFPGPSIGFKLTDGNADYDVEIDGVLDTIIRTKSNITQYTIATNLSEASHNIRIIKRSESQWNPAVFGGLYLADGKSLLSAPKYKRKLEFIGDSYTAGYGNEYYAPNPDNRGCDQQQLRSYTNANRSFPMLVAKAFHAQPMILGWSGKGMVRNYGDAAKKSDSAYTSYYGRTLCAASNENWDFTRWTADVVVICLCTNDYSTTPHPDDTMFSNAYHAFITKVLGNYPNAQILCVGTNTDSSNKVLKRIVAKETGSLGHAKVYLDSFPDNLKMMGCDWHPTVSDDSAVAKVLIKNIIKNMGWDTAASTIADGQASFKKKAEQPYLIRIFGNKVTVIGSPALPIGTLMTITDLKGRTVVKGRLDTQKSFSWNISRTAGGVYFIGNRRLGWTIVSVSENFISQRRELK